MQPWETLREDLRESNRQQADDIAAKLHRIGYSMMPVAGREPASLTFTGAEVEIMAEMEHVRWMAERRLAGWVYGPLRDVGRKITPYLVPYAELTEEVKEWDREAVRAIPDVLALAKFEVYRLGGGRRGQGNCAREAIQPDRSTGGLHVGTGAFRSHGGSKRDVDAGMRRVGR